jgi:hypothetical protein
VNPFLCQRKGEEKERGAAAPLRRLLLHGYWHPSFVRRDKREILFFPHAPLRRLLPYGYWRLPLKKGDKRGIFGEKAGIVL